MGDKPTKFEILRALGMAFLLLPVIFLSIQHFKGPKVMDMAAAQAAEARDMAKLQEQRVAQLSSRVDQLILDNKALKTAADQVAAKADQALTAANAAAANPNKEVSHVDQPSSQPSAKDTKISAEGDPSRPCSYEDVDEVALHETPGRFHRLRPCSQPAAK